MRNKVRWGMLGAGLIADERMAPGINKSESSELIAVMARNMKKAKNFLAKHGGKRTYNDENKLVQDDEVDAIYISTPNAFHHDHIVLCATHGKHVLVEKPMAMNLRQCKDIIACCNENNVKLMVAFLFRFNPCHRKAHEWVKGGVIGKPLLARVSLLFDLPPQELDNPWRLDPVVSGGGPIMEVGVHLFDLLRFILSKEVVEVMAFADRPRNIAPGESVGNILLRFEGGCQAEVMVGNRIPYASKAAGVTATGIVVAGGGIEVHGSEGSLICTGSITRDPIGTVVLATENDKIFYTPSPEEQKDIFAQQAEHFARCIIDDREPKISGEDGLKSVAIVTAAYESCETGRAVKLVL